MTEKRVVVHARAQRHHHNEDPIEMVIEEFNQTAVQPKIGIDFAHALRHILRQDPDVIMVGEIRDPETAQYVVQAAFTGHLVFSTLHTNDAPSAVTRLIGIGLKPFLVASSTRAMMAQCLVRKICKRCGEPYTPPESELRALYIDPSNLANASFKKGKGSSECNNTGHRGRFGERRPRGDRHHDLVPVMVALSRPGTEKARAARGAGRRPTL